MVPAGGIIGRGKELAALGAFLERARERPCSLLIEGEAGAGKTTLWLAGCEAAGAGGARVLTARPLEAEAGFSFAAIADLLADVEDTFTQLPEPQARAVRVALLLEPAGDVSADERAVAHGLLGVLRALAAASAVVVAVDDIQWLDTASARVLGFAARRLTAEPVGFLTALRVDGVEQLPIDPARTLPELSRLAVDPLGLDDLHRLVEERLAVVLPRPLLTQVWRTSGGNPFFALELARALAPHASTHIGGDPLPVPTGLGELVSSRVAALPDPTRELLLTAAALADPTLETLSLAVGGDVPDRLAAARDADVADVVDGRVRFSHPLLAAAAYEAGSSEQRRAAHRLLAGVVANAEERARHLAAAAEGPDELVAAELERAAATARARGAPVVAAELGERAARLTPADHAAAGRRRLSDAAYWIFEAGDGRRARLHLEHVLARAAPGPERAQALVRLARVRSYDDDIAAARELFLTAIPDATEPALAAEAHEGVAGTSFRLRRHLPEGVEHAAEASVLAGLAGRLDLEAEALASKAVIEALLGREEAVATFEAALELQPVTEQRRVMAQPAFTAAVVQFWRDDLDGARARFLALLSRAHELHDESSLPYVHVMLGQVECVAGRLVDALRHAEQEIERARQAGQETLVAYLLAVAAWANAYAGAEEATRAEAAPALELAERTSGVPAWFFAVSALGQLELARGDARAADAQLAPLVSFVRDQGMSEPSALWCVVDEIEALIELGRADDAGELLDWYEGNATRLGRVAAQANALRCRGRLAAAHGDAERALASLAAGLELHRRLPRPIDEGRTLIALGAAQRRAKERRAARETLELGQRTLVAAGARLWCERASSELGRIGGRAPSAGELTPVERRVAELAAAGSNNREIAAGLSLSTRTVEGHLSRVYAKLGIRSRVELARRLDDGASKVR
jgi:DNA-binding CsgD family transcriptional regulator/tetratricopeptide (TPR) repeat protein